MLQIKLRKPSSESGGAAKPLPVDSITVACPDHLVLADLPVAKSLGLASSASISKAVGRKSRRQLGERVHFCVRCDFPIAIYGRLSPCEHAFCLDCARSDSLCYLCDDRIQKIQTIKLMEGIFICAAPHCLKSFIKKNEFEAHIHGNHADLLHPNAEKDGNVSDTANARKPTASDSTVQAPPRSAFSPTPGSQVHDREDKASHMPSKLTPPSAGQIQSHQTENQGDSNPPPGFERSGPQNQFPQQTFEMQGGMRQEPGQFQDKQQGVVGASPFPEYPINVPQPHGFMPVNPNPVLAPPQFGYPHFVPDGAQPYYGAPYDMRRPDSAAEAGSEQGSLLGFPPGPAGAANFAEAYPRPWNMGQAVGPFDSSAVHGFMEGFMNAPDPQGRNTFFQGNSAGLPPNMPPASSSSANKGLETGQGGYSVDPRDGKTVLAPQPMPLPPPPPLPPHMHQLQRGRSYSGDTES
nr:E3 ubiquitin-protein ligase Hakai [Ipomoea batatas]